jgi:DNA-binding beta-propeller fold protein YncE
VRRAAQAENAAATVAAGGVVVASVPLPDWGTDVVAGSDGRVYVMTGMAKLAVVDPALARVTATVELESRPYGLALTPDARRAYVADLVGQYVWVVDTATATVKTRIPTGTIERPSLRPPVAVTGDGLRVWVGQTAKDHLLSIGTGADQVGHDIFLDIHPAGLAVSPDDRTVYVAGCALVCTTGTVLVIDAASGTITKRIELPRAPAGMVLHPDGRRAYLVNTADASVTMVDVQSGTSERIPVGPEPTALALGARGAVLYVTSAADGTLAAIATATNTPLVRSKVGRDPRALAVSADGSRAYVTHATATLSIVDLARLGR